ncbi:MAG: C4-dicarboxylate ABC transporter [Methylobacter sp.]|nr:MAG: C4-dicarboxylate ABC transporter [Methylobacter sp.]
MSFPVEALRLARFRQAFALAGLMLLSPAGRALDHVSLAIGGILGEQWQLENARLTVERFAEPSQQLVLSIAKIKLPQAFGELSLVNIACPEFNWGDAVLSCRNGTVQLKSERWQSPPAVFSFRITGDTGDFKLEQAGFAGGQLSLTAQAHGGVWQARANGKNIQAKALQKLVKPKAYQLSQGRLDIGLSAKGGRGQVNQLGLDSRWRGWTGQNTGGSIAAENLSAEFSMNAVKHAAAWAWQSEAAFQHGAVYWQPVYFAAPGDPVSAQAAGVWQPQTAMLQLDHFVYRHPQALTVKAGAKAQLKNTVKLQHADIAIQSPDLKQVSEAYLKPLSEGTPWQGAAVNGQLRAELTLAGTGLKQIQAVFNGLSVTDENARFQLDDAGGELVWSDKPELQQSQISWQKLAIKSLPVGPGKLSLWSGGNKVELAKAESLPFLGGTLVVDQFKWQRRKNGEPEVDFAGKLVNGSLEKLSAALGWTPLSGNLSGVIPKVGYHNQVLKLDGELQINVFGGAIRADKFEASGLFTALPVVSADLAVDNLDLDQLTRKFEFGSIEGKLSGYVNGLTLENWRPVSFFAWLGTPDGDDSRHRISQKAVNNLASIGGGGAADVLSRGFLSFFDSFGYDKIGLGCYLHQGVCQLMGVAPLEQGYYIVKGGGVPRIDVIGYNPRVDWSVLLERLSRVTHTENAVVQ